MGNKIKFKRGSKNKLPQRLAYGEPAFVSDEQELYIGTESGKNIKLTSKSEINRINEQLDTIKNNIENIFYKVDGSNINADNIIKSINKCAKNGGGTVIVAKQNDPIYLDKYINVPVNVVFDGSNNTFIPTANVTLQNNFLFGMNSSDGINWDKPYYALGCVIKNCYIFNENKINLKAIYVATSGATIENIVTKNCKQTIKTSKHYKDSIKITNITQFLLDDEHYGIEIDYLGDALEISRIHTGDGSDIYSNSFDRKSVRVVKCSAGKIYNCVNGEYSFEECSGLTFENFMFERGRIYIKSSFISIRDGYIFNSYNKDGLIICTTSDSPDYRHYSSVTIDNISFGYNLDSLRNTDNVCDIALDNGAYNISNCSRVIQRGNVKVDRNFGGIIIKKYDKGNLSLFSDFNNYSQILSRNCLIIDLEVHNPFQISFPKLNISSFGIRNVLTNNKFDFDGTAVDYYYDLQVLLCPNRKIGYDSGKGEISVTNNGKSVELEILWFNPALVRIYRGVKPGLYNKYVDIPFNGLFSLIDTGNTLSSYVWIDRVESCMDALNNLDKIERFGKNIRAYGTVRPTISKGWLTGDIVYNNNSVGGQPMFWHFSNNRFIASANY